MRWIESILSGARRSVFAQGLRGLLWFASGPYGSAIRFRNWLYDREWLTSHLAPLPVLSVGNLTAGGTGKTPACAYLARWFRARGVRVAILSRGYGALHDGVNDEAKELEQLLPDVPQLQSPDRVAMAQMAAEELDMQLLLLDDAFQHRRIRRDLDLVLVDATEPFGFGHLLPRGLLREPIGSLRRADLVIATRADQVEPQRLAEIRTTIQRYSPRAAWVEASHAGVELINGEGETRELSWLDRQPVVALSAIGNPTGFENSLRQYGARIVDSIRYPDHHAYSAEEVTEIRERVERLTDKPAAILCTGKDLAKLGMSRLGACPLWAMRIELKILRGEEILEEHLLRILDRVPADPSSN
jgi:tetraacyldisaccharide 4'-kinase